MTRRARLAVTEEGHVARLQAGPLAFVALLLAGTPMLASPAAQAVAGAAAATTDPAAGPLERAASLPSVDRPAPARTKHVAPAWPPGTDGTLRLRVHVVVDANGQVAEARVVGGGATASAAARPGEVAAVLDAVRQWTFEPPPAAPMLLVTYVGAGDDEGVVAPRSSTRAPLRVGGNIRPPAKVHHVTPDYPPEALAARVGGVVVVELTVDPEGAVTDARVLRSIVGLDEAAIAAVRQWRYTPTWLDGAPVSVVLTTTVNFQP